MAISFVYRELRALHLTSFFLFFIACAVTLRGQLGVPYLQQYAARDYGAAEVNYAAGQHPSGLLYVANPQAVLEFDGVVWRKMAWPGNRDSISWVGVGPDYRVYALAGRKLGVLHTVGNASIFRDVPVQGCADGLLPGPLVQAFRMEKGIYLATTQGLVLATQGIAVRCVARAPQVGKLPALAQLLHQPKLGLVALQGSTLAAWPGPPRLADANVRAVMQLYKHLSLIITDRALYLFDGWNLRAWPNQAQEQLAAGVITDARMLSGGILAISTQRSGLFVLDLNGRLLTQIDRTVGLQNEAIYGLHVDGEAGLWLMLESGITRLNILDPMTFFNASVGLKGAVNSVAHYHDTLYVGTDRGLYWLDRRTSPAQFMAVRGVVGTVYQVQPTPKRLLVASEAGLLELQGNQVRQLRRYTCYTILAQSNTYYVGTQMGVAIVQAVPYVTYRNVRRFLRWVRQPVWTDSAQVRLLPGYTKPVRQLAQDAKGQLWMSEAEGAQRLELDAKKQSITTLRLYGKAEGLPAGSKRMQQLGGRLLMTTDKHVYEYDVRKDVFVAAADVVAAGERIDFIYQDALNDRLLLTGEDLRYGAWQTAKRSYVWDSSALQVSRNAHLRTAYRPNAEQYWLGFDNGLILFQPKRKQVVASPYYTLVRQVQLGADSVVYRGGLVDSLWQLQGDTLRAPGFTARGDYAMVRLHLAATRYDANSRLQYSYALLAAQAPDSTLRWSAWSDQSVIELSYLPQGKYQLLARAREANGQASGVLLFGFAFLPKWYQTWWAWTLFILLGAGALGGIVYGSVRWYSYSLRERNLRLARIVEERTREIATKNIELEQYNAEILRQKAQIEVDKKIIEQKNRDITDSIVYAKRIQEAMLPKNEQIKASFEEFFILNQPRDIVSGDFYWFSQRDHSVIIAAGDCTGHGVPGALMSMIGSSLLNRIVNEQLHQSPAEILQLLHVGVQRALGQHIVESYSMHDGMDICICRVDFAAHTLQFASANRPLYRFSGGQFVEEKGDKMAVGGKGAHHQYTEHEYQLAAGDSFYLFSDGIVDQFGGQHGRKYQTRRFKEFLQEHRALPMPEQARLLRASLLAWQGEYEQVDDMLAIGVRFVANGRAQSVV